MITLASIQQIDGVVNDPDFGIIIQHGLDKIVLYGDADGFNYTHWHSSNWTPFQRHVGLCQDSDKAQECLKFALYVATQ